MGKLENTVKLFTLLVMCVLLPAAGCVSDTRIAGWPVFELDNSEDGRCECAVLAGTVAGYCRAAGRSRFDLLLGGIFLTRSVDVPGHRETMWCMLFDLFHTADYSDVASDGVRRDGTNWRVLYGLFSHRNDSGVRLTRIFPFIGVYRAAGICETSWIWRRFMSVKNGGEGPSGYFMFIPW